LKHQVAESQSGSATATLTAPIVRPLTLREREILDLMRRGRKNREIAGELCIAESTVHKHVQNIFEKLHARNRTEAIYLTSNEG
jgi:DNA-binding NarL/FixJ family response regulator